MNGIILMLDKRSIKGPYQRHTDYFKYLITMIKRDFSEGK